MIDDIKNTKFFYNLLIGFISLAVLNVLPCYGLSIYAHRGGRGLSPENTLPAFRTAVALCANYVDMDVGMTKDEVVIVMHGFSLDPDKTRDMNGEWIKRDDILVSSLTLAQLQKYDVGRLKPFSFESQLFPSQWPKNHTFIPTLKQAIDYVKSISNQTHFQIEIKTDPEHPNWTAPPLKFAKAIAGILQKEGIINRTEIQSLDFRPLLLIQKINPNIRTSYATSRDTEKKMRSSDPAIAGLWTAGYLLKDFHNSIPAMIFALGGKAWSPQDTELKFLALREAHQLGLKVVVWNYAEQSKKEFEPFLTKRLIHSKIDGIITDRPDMLRGMLIAAGQLALPSCHN